MTKQEFTFSKYVNYLIRPVEIINRNIVTVSFIFSYSMQ